MNTTEREMEEIGGPMDPEILLVSAYLSGELSPVAWNVIDEWLEEDAEFRDRVQPILDVWSYPAQIASDDATAAMREMEAKRRDDPRIDALAEAGWQRFLQEESACQPAAPSLAVTVAGSAAAVRNHVTAGLHSLRRVLRGRMPVLVVRWSVAEAFGFLVFFSVLMGIDLRVHALDHGEHETLTERGFAWFNRTVVTPDRDTRRMEIGGGTVVTLGPASQLVFRRAKRVPEEVLNVQGTAVIEVAGGTTSASLYTPAGTALLTPGRYVVQSVDAKSPMVIGVESGSARVQSRQSKTTLTVTDGQYAQLLVGHAVVLLPGAPPGLPKSP